MFKRLLIANRGEIACRVIRTAQQMGLHCIAVYSDADANAPHVKLADEAYCIGASPARESYLCGDRILAVAKLAQADAIHPGYGFLSENAAFAEHCAQSNIVFIGPPAQAIVAMGSKSNAKHIMQTSGVPLIPGYHGEDQTVVTLEKAAQNIGYPVLLKAAAGGGGKGMRVVNQASEFETAIAAVKREALSSFGDDHVLIEKYLAEPRHVEIQIFSDTYDNHVYLFERDCSIQRRHQKILEEAPAPHLNEELRRKMGEAAVACAKAIAYVGAGTVEFLVDDQQQFYFMEMNTRLQVEHPVTEMITGLDLVAWQLKVAAGEKLPLTQEAISLHGHAIEARIYAEDPSQDFLPSIGSICYLQQPPPSSSVRIDTGIEQGSVISQYYDPMLAKLIVWGEDRTQAILRLQQALAQYKVIGVKTNLDLLSRIVKQKDYMLGKLHTNFIPQYHATLAEPTNLMPEDLISAALFSILSQQEALHKQAPFSPWHSADNWRLNLPAITEFDFLYEGKSYPIRIQQIAGDYQSYVFNNAYKGSAIWQQPMLNLVINSHKVSIKIISDEKSLFIFNGDHRITLQLPTPQWQHADDNQSDGHLKAPMPGTVTAVLVKPQQSVKRGDALIILEAMKMEHTICAPLDGIVTEICYTVGETVNENAELIILESL